MGSLLNFVFPYKPKNAPDWILDYGPLYQAIIENYSYSFDFELNPNKKNFIVLETHEKFKGAIYNLKTNLSNTNIVDFVLNNDVKLLISSIADPAQTYEKTHIENLCDEFGIREKTYFIESNFNHINHKNTYCWHYFIEGIEGTYESKHNSFYRLEENDLGYITEEIKIEELDNSRNKKFLSLNRTVDRPHRLSLLNDYLNNDFCESYFSFINYNTEYESTYSKHNIKTFSELQSILPIELDTQAVDFNEFNVKQFKTHDTMKKELFLDSCIHLVTETTFDENELFVSEKILKPILNYQPFIVFGPAFYIKTLKELGFKTFSEFWSEDYDNIENGKERYSKLINLVLGLNKKSITELNELYQKTKDICIYNRNHFFNLSYKFHEIVKNLENEW